MLFQLDNYVQQPVQQPVQQQQPIVAQPVKPIIPIDSLLNSDNNLSEEVQPILKPTPLVDQNVSSDSKTITDTLNDKK